MDERLATRHSLIVRLRDPADAAAWREFVALYEPLIRRWPGARGSRTPTPVTSARRCSGPSPARSIAGTPTRRAAASAVGCHGSPATC